MQSNVYLVMKHIWETIMTPRCPLTVKDSPSAPWSARLLIRHFPQSADELQLQRATPGDGIFLHTPRFHSEAPEPRARAHSPPPSKSRCPTAQIPRAASADSPINPSRSGQLKLPNVYALICSLQYRQTSTETVSVDGLHKQNQHGDVDGKKSRSTCVS